MKSRKIKAIFTFVCIVTLLSLFISVYLGKRTATSENDNNKAPSYYTVAEYQGKVAVFMENEKIPIEIFDAYAESFPEHDRKLLRDGIRANSAEELQKIIEDYTS